VTDPFANRRGKAFLSDQMPDWTAEAACRDKVTVQGQVWEAAFSDVDLTYKPSGEYRWSASLLEVMATCASCPVRPLCLERGFALEEPVLLGWRPGTDDEDEWVKETLVPMPVGVYGGVPGPMRQRFKLSPDRLSLAAAWFHTLSSQRGWSKPAIEEVA
jgi:hypothetical protein